MNQSPTKVTPIVTGHFDGIEHGMAVGWAFDPAKPGQRLQVEILSNGEVVAAGIADKFREDLVSAGIGDGKHLFRLPLSYELKDGGIHSLIARDASTGIPLQGGDITFGPEERSNEIYVIRRKQGLILLESMLRLPEFRAFTDKASAFIHIYRVGALAQETGQLEDARYAWETLQKAIGQNALCHCKLGEISLAEKNWQAALDAYRAAIAIDFGMHYGHIGMAHARCQMSQYIEAEQAAKIAVGLQPTDPMAKKYLEKIQAETISQRADALLAGSAAEAAKQLLKQALINDPDNKAAESKLGEILMADTYYETPFPGMDQLKRLQKAQRLLEYFLRDYPRNVRKM